MQEIKIYDFDFNLLASEFKCISFDWEVRLNSIGSFEGVFTLDSPVYKACSNNEFTVCVQGENQGIVTKTEVKDDRIIVSGKSMNYILEKRVCPPFSSDDYGEELTEIEMVSKLVSRYCGDFMEVMPAPELEKVKRFVRIDANPLSVVVSELLGSVNFGYYVNFDVQAKKWVFGFIAPEFTDIVLSRPDKTLEECDYQRSVDNYAVCAMYKQKAKYMGLWDAVVNNPMLFDENPDNFAKVYRVIRAGSQFGKEFEQGSYVLSRSVSGKLEKESEYDDFWCKISTKEAEGALKWECVLPCSDIEEATEMLLEKVVEENVTAITRGENQKELKVGDVVEIRISSGENAMVFARQVKKMNYRYHWNECFVKPVFYKMKENEDE